MGVPKRKMSKMKKRQRIAANSYEGVQANFWTEWVEDASKMQYLLLPRLAAVAEAAWTPQDHRTYSSFLERLRQEPSFYRLKGLNYGKHVFK